MKNYYIFMVIILFHLVTISVSAGNSDKIIYDNPLVDSMRSIKFSDHVKALKIGFSILEQSNLSKASHTIAQTYTTIGNIFFDQGFYGLSEEYYAKAMLNYIELQDTFAVAWLYISMGNLNYKNERLENAGNNYKQAMRLFIETNCLWCQATVHNNLALIQIQQNDLLGAQESYGSALRIRRLMADSALIAHSYIYIGELYLKQNNLKKANDYLHRAFEIGLFVKELNILGRSSQLLGDYYIYIGDTLKADNSFNIAEKNFIEYFNANYLIDLYHHRAELSMESGNHEKGKEYLLKALSIAKVNNLYVNEAEIYEHLLGLSEDKLFIEDTTIQHWQSELSAVYKNLYNAEVGRSLRLIEMRDELINYKVQVDLKDLKIKKAKLHRNTSIIIGLLVLLLLFVIYLKYRDKRIKNIEILKQKEKYFKQQIDLEQLKTEKIKLELDVEHRGLLMKSAFIQHKNELISTFIKDLKYRISLMESDQTKGLRNLLTTMRNSIRTDDVLADFEKHFVAIYPTFIEDLSRSYPELSAKELKICAYHKMNLDTKEIARIMSVTIRAVQTSRYRIRQKLKISTDVSLITFFNRKEY